MIEHGDHILWDGLIGNWGKMKPQLKKDSFNKCAYCVSDTAMVAHGDIEHFRPKSVYWWLALCVDNYIYVCQICNQTYKSNHFPITGPELSGPNLPGVLPASEEAMRRLVEGLCPDPAKIDEEVFLTEWLQEGPHVPHPYLEDPEPLLAWAASETAREIALVAPDNATLRSQLAVAAVIAYLGLNRDTLTRSSSLSDLTMTERLKERYALATQSMIKPCRNSS